MYNKVEICGINTSKLRVLSEEEKNELMIKTKKGDFKAREELINGNLRLVLSVLQGFQNRGENPDDLFQVGCIGLIKAIDNFDISLDVKFSTYAVPMIVGEIRRYLRDNNAIRVSRSVKELAYKALQAKDVLQSELSREPSNAEIAKYLDVKIEAVVNALEAIVEPVSIFEPVYSDGTDSIFLLDQISDTKNTSEKWITDIALNDAFNKLCKRERDIIDLRFFKGKTQTEVASEIGISQAQVSRIEKSALEHMRGEIY